MSAMAGLMVQRKNGGGGGGGGGVGLRVGDFYCTCIHRHPELQQNLLKSILAYHCGCGDLTGVQGIIIKVTIIIFGPPSN